MAHPSRELAQEGQEQQHQKKKRRLFLQDILTLASRLGEMQPRDTEQEGVCTELHHLCAEYLPCLWEGHEGGAFDPNPVVLDVEQGDRLLAEEEQGDRFLRLMAADESSVWECDCYSRCGFIDGSYAAVGDTRPLAAPRRRGRSL